MFLEKLYVSKFRGIDERELDFSKRLNIISGKGSSGKTSIVDSILFLQRYVMNPSTSLEPLLHTWFTSSLTYTGSRKSSIVASIVNNNGESVFFELEIDIKKNTIEEKFVYKDTVIATREGSWVIYNVFIDSTKPLLRKAEELKENIWDNIEKKILKFEKPPFRTITGVVNAEILYYGFKTAYRTLPESLSTSLINVASGLRNRERELLKNRVVDLFKNIFKIIYFFRNSIVLKGIDYKNAIGPSKIRGSVFDPYCSNLPWIIHNVVKKGELNCINNCLEKLGLVESIKGVEKTVDRRYYLVVSTRRYIVTRESIPFSVVKSIIICSAVCYPSSMIVIDDFDEYLDNELTENILKYFKNVDRQIIVTTRRKLPVEIDYEHNIISM